MPTCPFGWWLNTTRTWTSTTCGPEPRSHCRGWCPSIASDAAILHVLLQNGAGVRSGVEAQRGAVRSANVEFELAACGHAPERTDVKAEVRRLAPGSDRPVGLAPELRRLHGRQANRPIVEHQGDGVRCVNVAGLLIISGGDVDPQAVAQGPAAIPLDRPQVGEGGAPAEDEHRV